MEKINKLQFKLNKIYYYLFKKRFDKKIDFDFPHDVNRWDLIQKLINSNNFKNYLEIGCDGDDSFSKIRVENKVGVDPYSGGNFRGTSDYFFSINNNKFDCIFIDGLHEYSQVYKDIKNSLDVLTDNGIILLHDCLPTTLHKQAVPRYKNIWNGERDTSLCRSSLCRESRPTVPSGAGGVANLQRCCVQVGCRLQRHGDNGGLGIETGIGHPLF